MRQLMDRRLYNAMPEMWPTRTQVLIQVTSLNAANQPVIVGFATVPGLGAVESRMAPFIVVRPDDTEIRDQGALTVVSHRNLKLNGYFPQITPEHYALVNDILYRVVGLEHDSNLFSSRLHLEYISPGNEVLIDSFANWDVVPNVDLVVNVDQLT